MNRQIDKVITQAIIMKSIMNGGLIMHRLSECVIVSEAIWVLCVAGVVI